MRYKQISFTTLELSGLRVLAEVGHGQKGLFSDPVLEQAANEAMDKVFRADQDMPRKAPPPPSGGYKKGPGLNIERKHRRTGPCECPQCRKAGPA